MTYGSHPLHHNSSLQRAISAQAGSAAFPYAKYRPVSYAAGFEAYAGIRDWWQTRQATRSASSGASSVAADAAGVGESATTGSGFWTGSAGPIAEVVGGLFAQGLTNRSSRKVQEGVQASNERIAIAQANAAAASGGAQDSYDEEGMGAGAVVGIVVAIAAVGGLGFYIYKKKKG